MWWWLACRAPDVLRPLELPTDASALRVTPGRAGGTVRIGAAGGRVVQIDGADDHRELTVPDDGEVDLVGLLPDTEYTLASDDGAVARVLTGHPDPAICPSIDVLAHDPARVGPGWLVLPHDARSTGGSCVLVLDEQLRPRWWYADRVESYQDAVFGPGGEVWMRTVPGAVEVRTLTGELLRRYAGEPAGDDLPLPVETAHHELLPQPDGSFWTFGRRVAAFEVPASYGSDETEVHDIDDTVAQLVAADGTLVRSLDPLEHLQPGRCGWDGLTPNHGGLDFVHANALVPLPDGRVLMSIRNQDVHAMFGPDGEVQWWFGDPAGWSGAWADAFLTPVGAPSWPYHSHGTEFDPETGVLAVFDNRPDGGSPYSDDVPTTARLAAWRVDEDARTVTFLGQREQTATGVIESLIMGDVDGRVDGGGTSLAAFGWVPDEGDGPVRDDGWGFVVGRLVEHAGDDVVLDLRLRVDGELFPGGGYLYRAARVPPLAP